jgi:D-beta-D-heptose 7-phosphate kinase/D-beta-D-heptose 1-phosphate adenosyltransferase
MKKKRTGPFLKIRTVEGLKRIRARLRREGKRVVFTNGCFDLIHGGHAHLFRWAKRQGDVLIVALNTDASVRRLKGPSRPIFPLAERFEVLAAVEDIDYLVSFGEDTPRRLIVELLPDVLVKGGDWGPGEIVGAEEVEAAGGRVVRVPYREGHSSTNLIDKIVRDFGRKRPGRKRVC